MVPRRQIKGDVKTAAVAAQQTMEILKVINSIRRMGRSISLTLSLMRS
jgi:hypothetical protein